MVMMITSSSLLLVLGFDKAMKSLANQIKLNRDYGQYAVHMLAGSSGRFPNNKVVGNNPISRASISEICSVPSKLCVRQLIIDSMLLQVSF